GAITFAEFQGHHDAMMRASFRTLDRSGDGRVDRSEFRATFSAGEAEPSAEEPAPTFDHLDTNKDGFLSLQELHGS
ncbi:MAG TPA: EF-hand domain-containing protein, partial [Brevundimonas sp.]